MEIKHENVVHYITEICIYATVNSIQFENGYIDACMRLSVPIK